MKSNDLIQTIIEQEKTLKSLKTHLSEIVKDVQYERNRWNFGSTQTETCEQVLHITSGITYKPHTFNKAFNLTKGAIWNGKEREERNYFDIYKHGRIVGYITTREGIYDALESHLKELWKKRVNNTWDKEYRGLDEFIKEMKKDHMKLIQHFVHYYDDTEVVTYQNKRLKIKKHYIFILDSDNFL